MNEKQEQAFNDLIKISQEMGLYDDEFLRSMNLLNNEWIHQNNQCKADLQ